MKQEFIIEKDILKKYNEQVGKTEVVIPCGIRIIDDSVFKSCNKITSIIIPNSVEIIESNAFDGCISLKSIVIPDSVMNIGGSIFSDCFNLETVKLSNNISWLSSHSFYNCKKLKTITIPDNINVIDNFAFAKCSNLETVILNKYLDLIGYGAFWDCTKLKNIIFPNNLRGIEDNAFSGCASLTSITIPDSVTHIGSGAFSSSYIKEINFSIDSLNVLDDDLKIIAIENIVKNYYTGKYEYTDYYLMNLILYIKDNAKIFEKLNKEIIRIILFEMTPVITKEDVIILLGKIKDIELKGMLLEYNNKKFNLDKSNPVDELTLDDYPKEK